MKWFELWLPSGLAADQLTAALRGLVAAASNRRNRPLIFELTADADGIRHFARLPYGGLEQLRAAIPGLRLETRTDHLPGEVGYVRELKGPRIDQSLRVDVGEFGSASMLATLQPLFDQERLVVQWLARPTWPPRHEPIINHLAGRQPTNAAEENRWRRQKLNEPLVVAVCRIGAQAGTPSLRRALVRRTTAALRSSRSADGGLVPRAWPGARRRLLRRSTPWVWPSVLNLAELTGLLGWPLGDTPLSGVTVGRSRSLPLSKSAPTSGPVVADSTYPGGGAVIRLAAAGRLQHLHVIGPTGVGKSTVLVNLARQDIAAGYGLVYFDPIGDQVPAITDYIPKARGDDVIVVDPTDEERPVGFNLLEGPNPELLVDQVVGVMHNLWRASWGPRTDDVLRASLLTIVRRPGSTIADVPRLLTDPGFRRSVIGDLAEPLALSPFWASYQAMSEAQRSEVIGPVLNKLRAFLLRRRVANVIAQPNGRLDFHNAFERNRIVLIRLPKGLLGEEAAALLGSLLLARLWHAAQARAGQDPNQRRPVFIYIDEFQDYLKLPGSVGDLLAQARALGLGVTVAHQHLKQLPTATERDVLANARSRVIFQTGAGDAAVLARGLQPHLGAEDLRGLGAREVVVTVATGEQVLAPVTGITRPLPKPLSSRSQTLARSRQRWGQPTKLTAKPDPAALPATIGRRLKEQERS